jgi:hypothetical protein
VFTARYGLGLYIQFYVLLTQCIYVFCVDLRTAIVALYSINLSILVTKAESVYCAVRTGSLNQTDTVSSLMG